MRREVRSAAVALGALALSRAGRAELPVKLTWDAPPECPTQADVMAELERIARVRPGRVLTSLTADAKIDRANDGRYRLRLRTERDEQRGHTELEASTCAPLERGVTLILALALGDGVEMIDEKSPPAASEPERAPARPPAVPEAPARMPERDAETRRSTWRWAPWVGAAGAWGLLAKPSVGNRIGVALGKTRWEMAADLTFWPPVSGARVDAIDASFFAVIGALGACARAPIGPTSVAACAAIEAGAIRGKSLGAFRDGSATAPYYAARPSLVFTAPLLGLVKFRAEADVSIAPVPPRFAIESFGEVYAVARYVPAVSLGLAFDR